MKTVGVIVPCRNEAGHIARFCAAVFAQQLPAGWAMQLVVADGRSDDGTRERLASLAAADARLVVIDNPGRIVSTGLNLALAATRGEAVVRMDVHTDYAADYIACCLHALQTTGADNVGGPWHAQPQADAGAMQQAIAAAFQSRWVAGGARSRDLAYSGWVDTVYLGCWPRASLARFGGFDETLVRNQDDELNLRITLGGGRIWQSADIRSVYRPRARLSQVFRQYLQYGYWKPFVMRKHGQAASLRQVAPGLLVAGLVVLWLAVLLGVIWPWMAALPTLAYAAAVLAMTMLAGTGQPAAVMLRLPAVIAAYHLGYGIGSIVGAWDALRGRPGRDRFAKLTR